MTAANLTTATKWVGVGGLFAVGFYLIVYQRDVTNGVALVSAALWLGGATNSLTALKQEQAVIKESAASIKDDLSDIKTSPNVPGQPLGERPEGEPPRTEHTESRIL